MAAEVPARDSVCPGCPRPPLPREVEVLIVKRDCRSARSLARACAGVLPQARIAMLHDGATVEAALRETSARLVVVGACLADHAWWPRLTDWAELWPRGRTLLLTDLQCADAHRALAALGPVSVHDLAADREADLAAAIQAVAIGRRWLGPGIVENLRDGRRPSLERKLSASQRVVLCLVGLLLDDREIARALAVSPEAVRQQCARIAGLLDLRGRARMIAAALRHGYVVHLPAGRSVPGLTHWLRGAGRAEARVR